MKNLNTILITVLLTMVSYVYAETDLSLDSETGATGHVEYNVPDGLLDGFKLINQSLSIDDAVKIGLEHNVQIKISNSNKLLQKAMLKGAKSELWPSVSIGALSFLQSGNSLTLMTPDMMMNTVDSTLFNDFNATLRTPLFTGGKIRGKIKASFHALAGVDYGTRQTIVNIAYEIREIYLQSLYSQAEHVIHKNHINVEQEFVRIAEERYQSGKGLKADILRIQTELADAKQMLNEKHNELANDMLDLKAIMGIDLASNIVLTDTLNFAPWPDSDLEELLIEVMGKHPAILEAKSGIEEAKAELKVARADYFPQVYGQLTGNLRLPDRPEMMGNGLIGLITASIPVFNRTLGADIKQAQAKLEKAYYKLEEQKLEIAKKVAQAWNDMQFAKENVLLSNTAVEQAKEDLRLIQKRWSVGRAIQIEVQDATLALRKTQLNNKQAIYNHEISKAKLIMALGKTGL